MIATKEHVVPGNILYTTGANQYGEHPWLEIIKVTSNPLDDLRSFLKGGEDSFTFMGKSQRFDQPMVLDAELVEAVLSDLSLEKAGVFDSRKFYATDYALDQVPTGRYNLYYTYTSLEEAQATFARLRDKLWTSEEKQVIQFTKEADQLLGMLKPLKRSVGRDDPFKDFIKMMGL